MNDLLCTKHGQRRMQQRGIRMGDIRLIQKYGTLVDEDTWLMLNQDVILQIESRKKEIQRLERLKNRKIVVSDDGVVTAYPSRPTDQKRALRRGRQKGYL